MYIEDDDRIKKKGGRTVYIPMGSGTMVGEAQYVVCCPEGGGAVMSFKLSDIDVYNKRGEKR